MKGAPSYLAVLLEGNYSICGHMPNDTFCTFLGSSQVYNHVSFPSSRPNQFDWKFEDIFYLHILMGYRDSYIATHVFWHVLILSYSYQCLMDNMGNRSYTLVCFFFNE